MIPRILTNYEIPFREQSGQIVVACPSCGKANHCYIDPEKKLYYCHKCQASGTFNQFLKVVTGAQITQPAPDKQKKPAPTEEYIASCHKRLLGQGGVKAWEYLMSRGITREAVEYFRLGFERRDDKDWIVIPYFKKGKPVNAKYRRASHEEKAFERWKDGESILFNQDSLSHNPDAVVYMTEAEIDCISLWCHGYKTVVSNTVGAKGFKPDWVDLLDPFQRINILYDSDDAGQDGAKAIAKRLGFERCHNVVLPTKDVNEFFASGGSVEQLDGLVGEAKLFDVDNILSLEDVFLSIGRAMDRPPQDIIQPQWASVAKLTGPYEPGDLIIVSAPPKIGKTTYALNEALAFARQDIPVFFYCLEMRPERLGRKLFQIEAYCTEEELTPPTMIRAYRRLEDKPFYFGYNTKKLPVDGVIETIRLGCRRYGFQFVVFDNLHFLVRSTANQTQEIAYVSQQFKLLAEELQIPIMLIVHPRKVNNDRVATIDDLKDSSSIGADADTVIILYRKRAKSDAGTEAAFEPETLVRVDASRFTAGGQTLLYFDAARSIFREIERREP